MSDVLAINVDQPYASLLAHGITNWLTAAEPPPDGVTDAEWLIVHLVQLDEHGSNGGRPTVCGLTRFDTRNENWVIVEHADLPGWGMGGSGVFGVDIEQSACGACWAVAGNVPSTILAGPGGLGPDTIAVCPTAEEAPDGN